MKINSIRLQNIKSYADRELQFFDGVNFISGINGAGKSTIIESIGFALFDVKPKPLINFLRDGAKSGAVTVQFTANDEREYRVVRKLRENTAYSWQVYDVEADSELDLHGGYDVKAWLAENLGIDPDQDPEKLFRDVIGVNQGNFTAPFLQSETPRKQVFNSILKVEGYREAYQKSNHIAGVLREAIREKERERDILLTRVENYDAVKAEVMEMEAFISRKEAELAGLQGEITAKEAERDRLQKVRAERDRTEAKIKEAEVYIKNLTENKAVLEKDLARAQEAARTVADSTPGYQEYLRLKEASVELEKQRIERDKLQAKLSELERDIGRSEAEIAKDRENIAQQRERLAGEEQGRTERGSELADLKVTAQQEIAQLAAPEDFLDRLKKAKVGLDVCWKDLQNVARRLEERFLETRDKIEPETAALEDRLAAKEDKARLAEAVEELEPAWLAKRDEVGRQYQRLKTLEDNRSQAAGGSCPFLNSPCQNVGGDLDAHFAAEIKKIETAIVPLQEELTETEARLKAARQAQQELSEMKLEAVRLEKLREDTAGLVEKVRRYVISLPGDKTRQAVAWFMDILKNTDALPADAAGLAAELQADLNEGLAGLNALTAHINAWDKAVVIKSPSIYLAGLADKFGEALDKFTAAGDTVGEMTERLNRFLAEARGAAAARMAALETEGRGVSKRLAEIREEQRLLKYKEDKAAAREKILADQRSRRDVQADRLRVFEQIDAALEEVRLLQAGHETAYNAYLRHQADAARVEEISADLARTAEAVKARTFAAEDLQLALAELTGQFDAAILAALEAELAELMGRRGTCLATLQERQRAAAEKKAILAQMEAWRSQAENVTTQIHKDRAALELLEFVRSTLNRAGEPIAAVYLQHLSREANVIYREVAKENVTLTWQPDYEIVLVDNHNGRERTRGFTQLSGGEQMTAALAVRLALLKHLSGTNIAFFDEPTTNLDSERRSNLAQTIPEVTAEFDQIFIISHDDTFDSMTDNILLLRKDTGSGTELVD